MSEKKPLTDIPNDLIQAHTDDVAKMTFSKTTLVDREGRPVFHSFWGNEILVTSLKDPE